MPFTPRTAANIIAGSGILRVAPSGTALPSLATLPTTWTGFVDVGYTVDGVTMLYTPTFKDLNVDEEMSPIQQLLTAEKFEIKIKMAESAMDNLAIAIAASTFTNPGTGIKTLDFGSLPSASIPEKILAFQGVSFGGTTDRVVIAYRAKCTSAVAIHAQRADYVTYDVTFSCLADGTKAIGKRLGQIIDYAAGS